VIKHRDWTYFKWLRQLFTGHRIEGCSAGSRGVEVNSNGTATPKVDMRDSESRLQTTQCRITSAGV